MMTTHTTKRRYTAMIGRLVKHYGFIQMQTIAPDEKARFYDHDGSDISIRRDGTIIVHSAYPDPHKMLTFFCWLCNGGAAAREITSIARDVQGGR